MFPAEIAVLWTSLCCACSLLLASYVVWLSHTSKCCWSWWQKQSQTSLCHCLEQGLSCGWCNKCHLYLKSNLYPKTPSVRLTGRELLENIYKNITFLHSTNQSVFSYFEKFIFSFVQLPPFLQWAFFSSCTVLSYWNFSFGKCLKVHFNHWKLFIFKNIEIYCLDQPLNIPGFAIQWFLNTTDERILTITTAK